MKKMALLLMFFGLTSQARAASFMIEMDPLAYMAKGYSLHLNTHMPSNGFIIDLGVFGMDIPKDFEPDKNFDTKFAGFGVKFNYTGSDPDGFFVGFSGGHAKVEGVENTTQLKDSAEFSSLGVQTGYRIGKKDWYILPWVGFDYALNELKISAGGKEYKHNRLQVFPTVHIGYQF